MINDAMELGVSPRPQPIPDFRAIKTSSLSAVSRNAPLIPSLRERVRRKFDSAVAQNLVFCNGYTVEEIDGECFKFCIVTAHGLSKKTSFWTSDSQEPTIATGSIVPSLLKHIRPSVSRRNSHASNLLPNLTTLIQLKVVIPDTQGDGFQDIRKSCIQSTGISVTTSPSKTLCHSPFLPPEPALTVGPIGAAHTLLLNKYCALPRQLLLITNEFQPQEGELRKDDWKALVDLLVQLRSSRTATDDAKPSEDLIFFNCGRNSGASQAHRHLQIVEWPESVSSEKNNRGRWFPEEVAMHLGSEKPYSHPRVPFAHFILPLPQIPTVATDPRRSNIYHQVLYQTYLTLLTAVQRSIAMYNAKNSVELPVHYNMIMTSTFMMLVPRRRGYCEGPKICPEVWVNSVGMLGMIWVKDHEEAEGWKEVGCENVLKAVGLPR